MWWKKMDDLAKNLGEMPSNDLLALKAKVDSELWRRFPPGGLLLNVHPNIFSNQLSIELLTGGLLWATISPRMGEIAIVSKHIVGGDISPSFPPKVTVQMRSAVGGKNDAT